MTVPDARSLDPVARFRAAEAVRIALDVAAFPRLPCWNYSPCSRHERIDSDPLCLDCGVELRAHQRVGATWLYLAGRGLLGDSVGMGKTFTVAAMLALCRESGELGLHNRAVIVVGTPAAVPQWHRQLNRVIPDLRVIEATGDSSPSQRISQYLRNWEVCLISPGVLAAARGDKQSRDGDIERLEHFPVGIVIHDDVDAMRDPGNRAAAAINRLSLGKARVVPVHGTPLQKRLTELYSFLYAAGGQETFGTLRRFRQQFVVSETVTFSVEDRFGRRIRHTKAKEVGVRNAAELRQLLAPLVLRRKAEDIHDVRMPALVHNIVWLDPSPAQRARYEELRQGVRRRLREDGEEISIVSAGVLWTAGWQICSGLAAVDNGRDDSVKLDWALDRVTGDLAEDKIVIFINFKPNVQAMSDRLQAAGVGHVLLWGNEGGRQLRADRLERFRSDPGCRVLLGTPTIERSLDLQAARHLIAVDTILNPQRMTQIAGRIRRDGSPHHTVYLHQLLLRNTQEQGYLEQLELEQAQSDTVWDEAGDLYQSLSARRMLEMIAGR